MNVLVVDDEALARLRLRQLLGGVDAAFELGRIEEAGDASAAVAALDRADAAGDPIGLVLLDIGMPGPTGTELAAQLRQRSPAPAVVFVTAHAEHAVAAFDLDAVDYLTKPVRAARLEAALRRVHQRRPSVAATPAAAADAPAVPVIVVNERGRVHRVPLHEVLYLKAELKYVTLRTADRSYVLDESLAELEPRLGDRVLRVHRNALVARAAIRALERRPDPDGDDDGGEAWAVRVAPVDEWIAVSRRQLVAVREALTAAGG